MKISASKFLFSLKLFHFLIFFFEQVDDQDSIEKEKEKRMLEVDLSMFGDLELPNEKDLEAEAPEENELGLPFKPHIPNSVAKEIDASVNSHSPLDYKLRKITLNKPDYSELIAKQQIPMSRIQLDPRLRRYAGNKPTSSTATPSASTTSTPTAATTSNTSTSSNNSTNNAKPKDPSPSPREDPR